MWYPSVINFEVSPHVDVTEMDSMEHNTKIIEPIIIIDDAVEREISSIQSRV